jgi:hypothetical protein
MLISRFRARLAVALLPGSLIAVTQSVAAPARPTPAEVHIVSLYEGLEVAARGKVGAAAVYVDRPGKEVILVLSGYDPIQWEVDLSRGTKVREAILAGYHKQTVKGLPAGTPLVEFYYEGRTGLEYVRVPYRLDSRELRPAVRALHRITGREIASYQGAYRFDPARPITVNGLHADPRLHSDFPTVTPAADLPKVRFTAVRQTNIDRFRSAAAVGEYTQAGPDRDTFKPLPADIRCLVSDSVGDRHFGLGRHEVLEIDLGRKKGTPIAPDKTLPEISWPCSLTYDTKRDRLLVATSGGGGLLYSYVPDKKAWAVLAELKGLGQAALTYHPKDDALYVLGEARSGDDGGQPVLYRLNAAGAVTDKTELGSPMFPGLLGRIPVGSHVQLAPVGDRLAALIDTGDARGEPRPERESFLFIIDQKSGKSQLAWKDSRGM